MCQGKTYLLDDDLVPSLAPEPDEDGGELTTVTGLLVMAVLFCPLVLVKALAIVAKACARFKLALVTCIPVAMYLLRLPSILTWLDSRRHLREAMLTDQ